MPARAAKAVGWTQGEIEESLGLVTANAVRARHIGRDILAGLKNIVGGEIGAYRQLLVQLLVESREQALADLERRAAERAADAIVAVRIATASVAHRAAEIVVYGTAVRLR